MKKKNKKGEHSGSSRSTNEQRRHQFGWPHGAPLDRDWLLSEAPMRNIGETMMPVGVDAVSVKTSKKKK
jgi:hypothetical protein